MACVSQTMPDLQLPLQLQGITAYRLVPNYTAWWQRHMYVNNLPRVALDNGAAGIRTRDLLIASLAPYRHATEPHSVYNGHPSNRTQAYHIHHQSIKSQTQIHHFLDTAWLIISSFNIKYDDLLCPLCQQQSCITQSSENMKKVLSLCGLLLPFKTNNCWQCCSKFQSLGNSDHNMNHRIRFCPVIVKTE